jgi:hypothetical protein
VVLKKRTCSTLGGVTIPTKLSDRKFERKKSSGEENIMHEKAILTWTLRKNK